MAVPTVLVTDVAKAGPVQLVYGVALCVGIPWVEQTRSFFTNEIAGESKEGSRPIRKKYDGGQVPDFVVLNMDPAAWTSYQRSKTRAKRTWQQGELALACIEGVDE